MSEPGISRTRGSRIVPTVGAVVIVGALVAASTLLGWPLVSSTSGADEWLPRDGQRYLFTNSDHSQLNYVEWTHSDATALLYSDLIVLLRWMSLTDVDWTSVGYLRARAVQVGLDGEGTALSDMLWTLSADGMRAGVELNFPGEIDILVPGRLDLPPDLVDGSTWTSQGTAHRWDNSASSFVELPYQASYQAMRPEDAAEARRGCLDVHMDYVVSDKQRTESHIWCPEAGVRRYTNPDGPWQLTDSPLPGKPDPEEPFDWSTADTLEFSPRIEQPAASNYLTAHLAPPGLLGGGAVFTGQLPPDVYGIDTSADPVTLVWEARPGGMPTAAATLGGLTVVATTNRQLIAYNSEGRWVWEADLRDLAIISPVRFGDYVVVATLDGQVTAFDLATGVTRWRTDLGAEIRFAPVVAGDRLLVANQAGGLACIDPTGEQLWVIDAGVPVSIAVSNGPEPVIVYGEDGSLVLNAYSLADGSQVWRNRVYEDARDLIGLDQVVVLRDNDRCLGIDWMTGEIRWRATGTRTFAGIGGGNRVLLLTEGSLLLLDDSGRQVRSWPHHLGDVGSGIWWLIASGDTVMALGHKGVEIGAQP